MGGKRSEKRRQEAEEAEGAERAKEPMVWLRPVSLTLVSDSGFSDQGLRFTVLDFKLEVHSVQCRSDIYVVS